MDPIKRLLLRYRLRLEDLGFADVAEFTAYLKALLADIESDDDTTVYYTMLADLLNMEIAVWRTRPIEFVAPGQLGVKFDRAGMLKALIKERDEALALVDGKDGDSGISWGTAVFVPTTARWD